MKKYVMALISLLVAWILSGAFLWNVYGSFFAEYQFLVALFHLVAIITGFFVGVDAAMIVYAILREQEEGYWY